MPSQIGRGRVRVAARIAVLLADLGGAVELEAAAEEPGAARLGLAVPVAVRGHDREVLLARVLDRVVRARRRHVRVDAVFLAAVVAADPGQAFARRRSAGGHPLGRACANHLSFCRRAAVKSPTGRKRSGLMPARPASTFGCIGDEADALGVVERREGQAGRALDQSDPGPVVRVPDREVLLVRRPTAWRRSPSSTLPPTRRRRWSLRCRLACRERCEAQASPGRCRRSSRRPGACRGTATGPRAWSRHRRRIPYSGS